MGLVPLEYVTFFGDDEWGIIESLNEPIQINLQTTFGFINNGMGGYVAIDYENAENDEASLWFSNDQPEYKVNFWDSLLYYHSTQYELKVEAPPDAPCALRNAEGDMPLCLLKMRLNWEKLLKPHCPAMSEILCRVWSRSCWALRTRVI